MKKFFIIIFILAFAFNAYTQFDWGVGGAARARVDGDTTSYNSRKVGSLFWTSSNNNLYIGNGTDWIRIATWGDTIALSELQLDTLKGFSTDSVFALCDMVFLQDILFKGTTSNLMYFIDSGGDTVIVIDPNASGGPALYMMDGTAADSVKFYHDGTNFVLTGDAGTGIISTNLGLTIGDEITDVTTLNGSITSDQTHSSATTPFYFRTSLSATSGEHNNLRARAQSTAESASTSDIRGVYGQGIANESKYAGACTGVFANAIGKNASTSTHLRGLFAEAETEATPTAVTNLYGAYIRTKMHLDPTTDAYGIMIDNEKMATGFLTDAYLGMKSTTWTGNSSAYGIDMNGIYGLSTADWRLHNGETIDNINDDYIEFQGGGGSDNTDLRIDLDGSYPSLDSPTDDTIHVTDHLQVDADILSVSTDTIIIDPDNAVGAAIGIGTGILSQELDLVGDIELESTTSNDKGVIYKGTNRFIHDFHHPTGGGALPDGQNVFIGENAGNFSMGSTATTTYHSSNNVGIGFKTLYLNTKGYQNIALGTNALYANTEGSYNSAFGSGSLVSNTTGYQNMALGANTLYDNTEGYANTAIGYSTGRGITTGDKNTVIGANVTGLTANLSNTIIIADGDGVIRLYIDSNGYLSIGDSTTGDKDAHYYAAGDNNDTEHFLQYDDGNSRWNLDTSLYVGADLTVIGQSSFGAPIKIDAADYTIDISGATFNANILSNSESITDLTSVWQSNTDNPIVSGNMIFARSRDTEASPDPVIDGDELGMIIFCGYDGTDYNFSSAIEAVVDETTVASDEMGGALKFSTCAEGTNSLLERIKIDNGGNVSIGATTAIDTQSPDLLITGDADADGTDFTTETLTISLTSNATPTSALWEFTSTQSAGYTFDKEITFKNNAAAVTFGAVATDADVVLAFDAVTAQGSITYMEDEDRFDFDNIILVEDNAIIDDSLTVRGNSDADSLNIVVESDSVKFHTEDPIQFNQNIHGLGTITTDNYTAANLLTACATNAGALDFSAGSKTLTIEDNATIGLDLNALEGLSSTGLIARTAANTYSERTLTGTSKEIEITNGDGISGNPTIGLPNVVIITDSLINTGNSGADSTIIVTESDSVKIHTEDPVQFNQNLHILGNVVGEDADFSGDLYLDATKKVILADDADDHTYIVESGADIMDFYVGGTNMVKLTEATPDLIALNGNTTLTGTLGVTDAITSTASCANILDLTGATLTQAIDNAVFSFGSYSAAKSVTVTDNYIPFQINIESVADASKWVIAEYVKIANSTADQPNMSFACSAPRMTIAKDASAGYGVQSHVTIADADVTGFFKAGSFKADRGSGATTITGEVSALQAILDGSATQNTGRANAFMAVVYSAVTDANEIGYFTANSSSTVGNGIYIANHGTMTNAIQLNSAGGTLVDGIDMTGTFSGYGIDLNDATISTADFRGNQGETWENTTTDGIWTTNGGITTTTDITSGDDVILSATGKVSLDGATPTTYLVETSDDVLDIHVGGANAITITEAATDYTSNHLIQVYTPNAASNSGTSVADDAAITVTKKIMRMVGADADALLDTDPAINDGIADGQIVIIQGTADANTVTIADNCNTQLDGAANCTLGDGDTIMLMWDSNYSMWIEVSRSDN